MKFTTSDGIYVQKEVIFKLIDLDIDVPYSIFEKVFVDDDLPTDSNDNEKFIKFTNKNEIDFFKSVSFISDLSDYIDKPIDEVAHECNILLESLNNLEFAYNHSSKKDGVFNLDVIYLYKEAVAQFESLRKIFWYKQGFIDLDLPKEELNKSLKKANQ